MDDQALRDYFDFDDADLAANRNGELSEKQQQKLIKERKSQLNASLKAGTPLLVLTLIFLLASIFFFRAMGAAVIVTILCMLLSGAFAFLFLNSALKDLKAGAPEKDAKVKKVEGPVRVTEMLHGQCAFLHARGGNWEIDDTCADCIHPGDVYAVYSNGEGELLSLEWISKG